MDGSSTISIHNVHKSFKDVAVLQGITLEIGSKESVAIIGKSGVGKSLILKHIIGLTRPDQGEVFVDRIRVSDASRRELEQIRSRMGFLFQNAALFDSLTVFENVALPLRETTALGESAIREKVLELLAHVGLEAAPNQYPSQLSGGMRKRVGLARALVNNPDIVLFDEPTTGLDPIRKNAVHDLISKSQRHHEFTSVIVSHEIPDIFRITDRVIMLDQGRIVVDTPSAELERVTDAAFLNFLAGVQSIRCPQTGLLSRTEFESRLVEECGRAQRYGSTFTLLLMEFSCPSESPHPEEWSFDVAYVLRKQIRLADLLARYDECCFAMILPYTLENGGRILGKRIRDVLSSFPKLPHGALSMRLGFSEYHPAKDCGQILREALSQLR